MSIVFTNGCFDIVHRGHIELFKYCRILSGDGKVIVGLNSDISVSSLKGPLRPINSQENRKILLESIRYIDEVVLFDELDPYRLIERVKPDFIVKGGDYTEDQVVGRDLAEVRIFRYLHGYSTTKIVQNIINR